MSRRKAIVCTKYDPPDGLQLQEVAKLAPKAGKVLVEVHAASVNAYDWHLLTADDSGVTRAGFRNSLEYIPYILTALLFQRCGLEK
jgi:NADPH:quinone reductase-like Zn-dependent oxidoreductase